jgi:membrane associated rhomboid family serine protease
MTPWVLRLIVANVAIYFLQVSGTLSFDRFVFVPQLVLVQPWSIVTYMFLHGGGSHLFFNMLGLFFFGSRVEMRLGGDRFLWLYFISGIAGALLSFVLSPGAAIIGASGGVYGIMMAFAMFWPREPIYIWGVVPIEVRWLVVIYTAFSVLGGVGATGDNVAHFAHLGGFVGAFLYLSWVKKRAGISSFRQKVNKPTVEAKRVVTLSRDQLKLDGVHALTREEVDRILDKISSHGIQSLTPEEMRFLSNFAPPDDRRPSVS